MCEDEDRSVPRQISVVCTQPEVSVVRTKTEVSIVRKKTEARAVMAKTDASIVSTDTECCTDVCGALWLSGSGPLI